MADFSTVIFSALMVAIPLTFVVSLCVLWQYSRSLVRWMRREAPPSLSAEPSCSVTATVGDGVLRPLPPLPVLAKLQQLERCHWVLLALLWLLFGITAALLWLGVHAPPPSPRRVLAVGIAWSSTGWVMLGLIARLPIRRGIVLVVVCLVAPTLLALLMANSASQSGVRSVMSWLTVLLLLPLPSLLVLNGIPSLRAIAPLLFPPVVCATALVISIRSGVGTGHRELQPC